MKRALATFAVLLLVGCNNLGAVGAACTTATDCDLGLSCNTEVPGGLCTHGCSFAGAELSECPANSVCTAIAARTLACAPKCTTDADCREKHTCSGNTGTTVKSCRPNPA